MQYRQAICRITRGAIVTKILCRFLGPFKFQHYRCRNVGLSNSKSRKFRILEKQFADNGLIPLTDFYKIRCGKGSPMPARLRQIYHRAFGKWLKSTKVVKI